MTSTRRIWRAPGGCAAVLALVLASHAQPAAAQAYDPEFCEAARDQIAYLTGPGAFVQEAGVNHGVDLLAENQQLADLLCDPADGFTPPPPQQLPSDPLDGPANPARSDPPAEPPAAMPPAPAPPAVDVPDAREDTDRDACVLVTVTEVGVAMKQSVKATPADPFGAPGAQGCEFDGPGEAYTNVIYVQGNGAFYYDSFHETASANGVDSVPGLGDRAFSYVGGGGPGAVVAKGDKLFALEFSGIGSGPAELGRLLALAHQAVGRVH